MSNRVLAGEPYSRLFSSLNDFKSSATSCLVCRMIMSALRESDTLLFDQANEFENSSGPSYHADGGTDIEGSRGKKVNVTLRINLVVDLNDTVPDGEYYTHLNLSATFLFGRKRRGYEGGSKKWIKASLLALQQEDHVANTPDSPLGLDSRLTGDQKIECILKWLRMGRRLESPTEQDTLPCRLLDVSDSSLVRLIQVDQIAAKRKTSVSGGIHYAALSHRWGASQHLTTTSASLEMLKIGISIAQLPRTFQDAVLLSQRIEIPYLWIDALCIIQDSPKDWLQESEKMGVIFRNAAITIAVHCASDDSEGFLSNALSKPDTVPCGNHLALSKLSDHARDITNSRLSRRGWVLQERLMSSRTIHFTSGRVYFEDGEGIADEHNALIENEGESGIHPSDEYTDPNTLTSAAPDVHELRQLLLLDPLNEVSDDFSVHQITQISFNWLPLVEMFSRCELTKESDKLIAIAGMARHIHAKIGQDWCAGIWKDCICQGLLWFSTKTGLIAPVHARAPSWSWAAWDGAVQYPVDIVRDEFTPTCQFVSLKDASGTQVNWLNATGFLTVEGNMADLQDLYFGDAIQVGPGPSRPGIIGEDLTGLPLMRLKDYAHSFWIRNVEGERKGWIVFDKADTNFIRQHSIPGNFDATSRMSQYEERFRPRSIFAVGNEHYFLVLGTYSKRDIPWVGHFLTETAEVDDTYAGEDESLSETLLAELSAFDFDIPSHSSPGLKPLDSPSKPALESESCSSSFSDFVPVGQGASPPTYFGIYVVRSPSDQGSFRRVGFGQVTTMPMRFSQITLV